MNNPDKRTKKMSQPFQLVLASSSPFRQKLLRSLGLPFAAVAPRYQEEHQLPLPPEELVVELACRKARSLSADYPRVLILGCDQLVDLDGEMLHKPKTPAAAVTQLQKLSGRTHRLLTGLCVLETQTGRVEKALDIHVMTMRELSDEQIRSYVDKDQPLNCAGAYKVEGPGIALFSSMKGEDFTGIIGLPLTKVVDLLMRFDVYQSFGH